MSSSQEPTIESSKTNIIVWVLIGFIILFILIMILAMFAMSAQMRTLNDDITGIDNDINDIYNNINNLNANTAAITYSSANAQTSMSGSMTIPSGLLYLKGTDVLNSLTVIQNELDSNIIINPGLIVPSLEVDGPTTLNGSVLINPRDVPLPAVSGLAGMGIYWDQEGDSHGETDLLSFGEGATGGFNFYAINSSSVSGPKLIGQLYNGDFIIPGTIKCSSIQLI